ncbi:hypothetical protein [Rhizobium leguminosarum]|uniref:hypothetical protein n=1 Tax=Rhizobium leguminosarum TaxID=384 RepID=UPI0014415D51|nr:hypothetical protein [Rhizobium leguminosarum]NKL58325.1 hypothetical protein [Rhizobium leguminosarum bv. viciae]
MISYASNFMGNFKLGDNIVFNLRILQYFYELYSDGTSLQKRLLQKPITILNVSITEAILQDFYTRMRSFTREKIDVSISVLARVRGAQIDDFSKYIANARRNDFFDLKDTEFYDVLDDLRKLRNRVHIQNEKRYFEPDDSSAFSAERMVLSEKALETVIETMQRKYSRDHAFIADFNLPWDSHLTEAA